MCVCGGGGGGGGGGMSFDLLSRLIWTKALFYVLAVNIALPLRLGSPILHAIDKLTQLLHVDKCCI